MADRIRNIDYAQVHAVTIKGHLLIVVFGVLGLSGCFARRPGAGYMKTVCPVSATASSIEATYSDRARPRSSDDQPRGSLYGVLTADDSIESPTALGWTTSIQKMSGTEKRHRVCLRDAANHLVRSQYIDLVYADGYYFARRHFRAKLIYVLVFFGENVASFGVDHDGDLVAVNSGGGLLLLGLIPLFGADGGSQCIYERVATEIHPVMEQEMTADFAALSVVGTSGINRNAQVRAQQRNANRR
jgi:hypothetical protein